MRLKRIGLLVALSIGAGSSSAESDAVVDALTKRRVSEAAAAKLDSLYVYPDMGAKIAAFVRQREKSGAYDSISRPQEFASALTADLRAVNHDMHLNVFYGSGPTARLGQPGLNNFGYGKPQRLSGNVGYLEVRGFAPREAVQQTVADAMNFLAPTDALIIDVRHNGGGDPTGVALLCSYLLGDKPVHINDLYWRPGNRTEQFWTDPKVTRQRYGVERPVYLLTSSSTFSAAEEFAYDLQNQKRVTIVGETTGGGAHPGEVRSLGDRFAVFIPTGRAINPVSGKDWEGTGVVPEVRADESDALRVAHTAALRALIAKTTDPARKSSLTGALAEVQRTPK